MYESDSSKVDLANATIGGLLKKITKASRSNAAPELVDVWVCDIDPADIKQMLHFINNEVKGSDFYDFTNLKRIKQTRKEGYLTISIIVSSVRLYGSRAELLEYWRERGPSKIDLVNLRVSKVPLNHPLSKDQAISWSKDYWPVSWKGNPEHQELLKATFNLTQEKNIIDALLRLAKDSPVPQCATLIVRQDSNSDLHIVAEARDDRTNHPLGHSVMKAIEYVAQIEKTDRLDARATLECNYLCSGLSVFTTHEPCIMCSMALVHSRIDRLTYIWPHPRGGVESSYFIGDRRDLNWTFPIWRWLGEVDSSITCCSSCHP